jgi:histidinol-phosphate aminotransferase
MITSFKDLLPLIRSNIQQLKPYSSARDEFTEKAEVYLDANENPFETRFNRYPDSHHFELRRLLVNHPNRLVSPDNIILGNGSDEIIDMVVRMCCNPNLDNIVICPPTYGMYQVVADINAVEVRKVNQTEGFNLNVQGILNAVDENTKLIFICSPNNPNGKDVPYEEIQTILEQTNCFVFVDEAYIDFSNQPSCTLRLKQFPQLIVGQTLSKFYGMAGLRLGMGIASKEIISILQKIKPPYNISSLTQIKVMEQLPKINFSEQQLFFTQERTRMEKALSSIAVVKKVFSSAANFLLIEVDDAHEIYNFLVKQGVIVRNRSNQYLCNECLRITIGAHQENNRVIELLQNYKK